MVRKPRSQDVENPIEENSPIAQASQAITDEQKKIIQETKLVSVDTYLKTGIHVGTKFRTKDMQPFIYKTRPDGLAVLDVQKIDDRIHLASKILNNYKPEDVLVVCRRENGWQPLKLFEQLTGIRSFAGRYPPGILTNPALETFIEAKLMIIVDAWADKNALADALNMGIVTIGLCDTNNQANGIDFVVPCNNKGKKSLGLVLYLLAREYLLARKVVTDADQLAIKLEKFIEE
jgi:small subunit ribosomal protein S2